jgi:hypothetical protein
MCKSENIQHGGQHNDLSGLDAQKFLEPICTKGEYEFYNGEVSKDSGLFAFLPMGEYSDIENARRFNSDTDKGSVSHLVLLNRLRFFWTRIWGKTVSGKRSLKC